MGKKTVDRVTFVAKRRGFVDGALIERGETFVQDEDFKGSWFEKATAIDVNEGEQGGSRVQSLLENPKQGEIVSVIPSLTDKELQALIDAESAGKRRKGLLARAEDERQNRVGRMGGSEERAKQPEEKDPLPLPGEGEGGEKDPLG